MTPRLASTAHGVQGHGRLAHLDGLRSMVILVLLVHFTDSVADSEGEVHGWFTPAYIAIWYSAHVGMEMFFVLSGFLITGILLSSKGSSSYFRTFYTRRFLRIFPLYYGVLVLYLVVLPQFFPERFGALAPASGQQFFYWLYLSNLAPLLQWDVAPGTAHFWSLAVEEQFYLLWPLVVFLCSPSTLKRVCFGCIGMAVSSRFALAATGVDPLAVHEFTLTQLDALGIGGLLSIHWRERGTLYPFTRWVRPASYTAIAVAGLVLVSGPAVGRFALPFYGTAAVVLGAGLVIRSISARPDDRWHRRLMAAPLQLLGRYSYGIYVLHYPLIMVLDATDVLVNPGGTHSADPLKVLAYASAAVPICVLAGALSWHLFEEPLLRLKRYFPYDVGGGARVPRDSDQWRRAVNPVAEESPEIARREHGNSTA